MLAGMPEPQDAAGIERVASELRARGVATVYLTAGRRRSPLRFGRASRAGCRRPGSRSRTPPGPGMRSRLAWRGGCCKSGRSPECAAAGSALAAMALASERTVSERVSAHGRARSDEGDAVVTSNRTSPETLSSTIAPEVAEALADRPPGRRARVDDHQSRLPVPGQRRVRARHRGRRARSRRRARDDRHPRRPSHGRPHRRADRASRHRRRRPRLQGVAARHRRADRTRRRRGDDGRGHDGRRSARGIRVFATGGIGGVHRGAQQTLRHLGGPARTRSHARVRRVRGRQVDSGPGAHARGARDPRRARARLPHRRVPGVLLAPQRAWRRRAPRDRR